jgi:group II intron reverse transcriptase/maturase
MKVKNRRKEATAEAQTVELERNSIPPLNGAITDKAEWEESILPSESHDILIATIEDVVDETNIQEAIKAVKSNKGVPGVDGITTDQIIKVMHGQWPQIREEILTGKYQPKPARRVEIPKPERNGVRQLGIPTVVDRVIQQAIHQVLVPVFDPHFSPHSFGFRPNRSAHQAILQAHKYIKEGCEWVVDIDLEKFFDRVNHDMIMARVARKVKDKKILLLIRRYLEAGAMENGLIKPTDEGTPQGGPLSPLLSNIMLDDLDKELEKRGSRFARYADDCNIYVKSEKAAKRVMESVMCYLTEKLRLKVNQQKSAIDRPWNRKFVGFSFTKDRKINRIIIHESRTKRLKDKIRGLTKKMRGSKITDSIRKMIMPITRGWANYFGITGERGIFESLDGWIRRKIRCIMWRQWKKPKTRYKHLLALGIKEATAGATGYSNKGPWRMARTHAIHKALSNNVIETLGYIPMAKIVARSECS